MREIKFRAWDKGLSNDDNIPMMTQALTIQEWLDQRGFYYVNGYQANLSDFDWKNELIFMQYTGLKDKNDVEIYEGDIVRWGLGFTGNWDKESWHRYAVVELFPSLQFRIIYYVVGETGEKKETDNHVFEFGSFAYKETNKYIEVIGNIYQNPELLEK